MNTEYEITVEYMDGRTEVIRCEWTSGPKDGVLHMGNVEQTSNSRHMVLSNVRVYTERRIR